jgi:hypothetical protein
MMRLMSLVLCLVIGLLFQAAYCEAFVVNTHAKVNIVQGMDASILPANSTSVPTATHNMFSIAGPADYSVNIHLASGRSESPLLVRSESLHDSTGQLVLDLPLNAQNDAPMLTDQLIITVVYE